MTEQVKNIIGFTVLAVLLLAVAIVGAMLTFHPSADGASAYIGVIMMVFAITLQVLLMMRGPNR